MSVFPSWPWTNFNNYNLDWVIKKVKYIEEHIEEIVVDATSDMLDDTLTNPDKAAQAKAAGDAIRGNASNITNLRGRMTAAESAITLDQDRLNALEAEGVHTYRMELFKSDATLTYYDKVKATITDMTNLIADADNQTPYIVLMNGNLAYGINVQVVGGVNTVIYGKTQVGNAIYNFQIYSNSVTGTASLQSSSVTPRVMIVSAGSSYNYFLGSYDVLQSLLMSYSCEHITLRLTNHTANYTTLKEWYGNATSYDEWIYLIFNNGDEIKCDSDGTITKMN